MLIERVSPHGGDIYTHQIDYDFSANISPLGTPTAVQYAIREAASQVSSYPDPYCRDLRTALSSFHKVDVNHIICGNGAADIIYSYAFATKPKQALVVSPTFCEYENALQSVDCNVQHYTLSEDQNFNLTKDLLSILNSNIDVVFICNPNNPTGVLYPKEFLIEIATKCMANDTILFVDECFFDLAEAPIQQSLVDAINQFPNLIILKAFTKSYGMAGLRLGYALSCNSSLLKKMCSCTQVWNVSSIAQKAGIAALTCTQHIKDSRQIINNERSFLIEELTKLGFTVFPSTVNFILFKSFEKDLYCKLLVKNVMIRRCNNFIGLNDSFYRCAVKDHTSNVAFISALQEVINNG